MSPTRSPGFHPVPKPEKRQPKEKKRPRRENYARSKKEFARCFHSVERVEFVKAMPCVWCGCVGFSENAHTEVGGSGMRAGYETIVALCGGYHVLDNRPGCHFHYDNHKAPFDNEESRQQVKACAPEVERLWQESRP